jgi:hypothetical protein
LAEARWAWLGLLALSTACGYRSTVDAADAGDVADRINTWSIDDDVFGSNQAFLACREAQAFDSDHDSVLGMTFQPGWVVGEAGSLTVSTSPRLAEGEITLVVSHGTASFVAQSGLVSWRSTSPDETWPLAVTFTDLPALDAADAPAQLSGSLAFGFSSCE